MKVTITPPLRCDWEMATMQDKYEQKLLQAFGSEQVVKAAEWDWRYHGCGPSHKYFSAWLNAIGAALENYTPSEVKITRIYHTYDV